MGKEDALGFAAESEEKVSFNFVSDRFAMGLSIVDQQTLTWFLVCVHSSLICQYDPSAMSSPTKISLHSPRLQATERVVSIRARLLAPRRRLLVSTITGR